MGNALPPRRDQIFKLIDQDGNGMITEDEVRRTRLFSDTDIEQMFTARDNEMMCKEDFDSYFHAEEHVPMQILEVFQVFQQVDMDSDGQLTLEELRLRWPFIQSDLACLNANELNENNIEPWFTRQDRDGDKKIDFAEFCHGVIYNCSGSSPARDAATLADPRPIESHVVGIADDDDDLEAPLMRHAVTDFRLVRAVPRYQCDDGVLALAESVWWQQDPKIAGHRLTWYHVAPPAVDLMWKRRPVAYNCLGAVVVQPLWTIFVHSLFLEEPSPHDSNQLFFPALSDGLFKEVVMCLPKALQQFPLKLITILPAVIASCRLLWIEKKVLKYTIVPSQLWLNQFKLFGIPLKFSEFTSYWIWLRVNFGIAFFSHLDIYTKSTLLAQVYMLAHNDDTSDVFDCLVRDSFGESAWFAPDNGTNLFNLFCFWWALSCLQPVITYALIYDVGNGRDLDYKLKGEKKGYKVITTYLRYYFHYCLHLICCQEAPNPPGHYTLCTWHADTLKFLAQAANFNVVMGAALSEIIERAKYDAKSWKRVHRPFEMVYKELWRNLFRYCVTIVWTCPTFCMQTYMTMVIINGSDSNFPSGAFVSVGITLLTFTALSLGIMSDASTCWKFLSDVDTIVEAEQIRMDPDEQREVAEARWWFKVLWWLAHVIAILAMIFMYVVVLWPAVLSWSWCDEGIWVWGKGPQLFGSCTQEAGSQCNLYAVAHL